MAQAQPPPVPTSQPGQEVTGNLFLLLIALSAAAFVMMWTLGMFRRGSILGPSRWKLGESVRPLWFTMLGGILVFLGIPIVYGGVRGVTDISQLSLRELIILSTAPQFATCAVILLLDQLLGKNLLTLIGLRPGNMIGGILRGVLGIAIVIPIVFWAGVLTEMVYQSMGVEHPMEHDLLRWMSDAPGIAMKVLAIAAAVLAAPLAEELLFRGHLQTLLASAFARTREPTAGFPVIFPTDAPQAIVPLATLALNPTWPRWIAVIMTTFIFTLIHPPWTWPPIAVLSICLGYAYERTGNLWVPITIHAMFNGLSTLYYLTQVN